MTYDLLLQNAVIVDGTGSPSTPGSIGVLDGRIAEVGDVDGPARRVVDAQGLVVCPGFVDLHTHYDAQVMWDPWCTPSSYHGVTTVVMGNCGYGLAPVRPEDRDHVMGFFAAVEGVSKATLLAGVPWEWETLPEYRAALERRGLGINVALQVGHSAIRRYAMGPDAKEKGVRPAQLEVMKRLVAEGLELGAVGFTTSRVAHQHGEFGEPIPSYLADDDEVLALATVLGQQKRGMLGINPRTKVLDFVQEDRDLLVSLARTTGGTVAWNEFSYKTEHPGLYRELLDHMEAAHRAGARVYAIARCQRGDQLFDLRSDSKLTSSGPLAPFIGNTPDKTLALLSAPDAAPRLIEAMAGPSAHPFVNQFPLIGIYRAALDRNAWMEGRSLEAVGRELGRHPIEVFLEVAVAERLKTQFTVSGMKNADDAIVAEILKSPATIIGISDGGAHLRTRCAVDYPTYLLGYWVRERGLFSLEEAIRQLTSVPAGLAGMADRGVIRAGAAADLCLFDPDTIGPLPEEICNDIPGGGPRRVKRAQGIASVIVNGETVVQDGALTATTPGQVVGWTSG